MSARSSSDRYGSVAIWIHWLSAAAIVVLFALGFAAANTGDPALKAALLKTHVPLGLFVLLLTVLRIVWWLVDRPPAPLKGTPRWQVSTEAVVRIVIYAAVILLGASGVGLLALSGAGAVLFFQGRLDVGEAMAPPVILALFAQRYIVRGLTLGAVKG